MSNSKIERKGNWFIDQLNLYQSANSKTASIKENFLIRTDEFNTIVEAIKNKDEKDPLQHELILGGRGSGKSTLLKRIEIEVKENKELNKRFVAINLAEEQAGIYRLFDLWEQVLNELTYRYKCNPLDKGFDEFETEESYTKYVYDNIHETCNRLHIRIVLLLDNFDRILSSFTDNGNLLRETLINFNDVQIIAASTRMDEHFWQYDKPFYEFFRRHRLAALSREEIMLLLNHWATTLNIPELNSFVEKNPGKIENIRLLTDGLPRTLQFFIQMVLQKDDATGYEYLKKIMDTVTPLYQERLNYLPPTQRKLVLELALFWEATNTGMLAEKARMESKLVSAQLKQLVEKGIVDKIETGNKNHLYRITERFFNLWLIITQGNPEQKRKAKWLSLFLESFYEKEEFNALFHKHKEKLQSGVLDWDSAALFSKALAQSRYISTTQRDEVLDLTEQISNEVREPDTVYLPKKYSELENEVVELIAKESYDAAIKKVDDIENETDGAREFLLGNIYRLKKEFKKSENYYLQAIDKGGVSAMYNLALMYSDEGKKELAESYYLQAIEKGHVRAMYNLALMYDEQGKKDLAESYYLQAIEKGDVSAMYNLAVVYNEQGKRDLAESYYLQAIKKGQMNAMYNLGVIYDNEGKKNLAENYYLQAIEKGHLGALSNLIYLYYVVNKKTGKALELVKKVEVHPFLHILVEVWSGVFNNVEERAVETFKKNELEKGGAFIFGMLVHQQKNLVIKLFNNPEIGKELQNKYMVLYYVTLLLNGGDNKNISLRIPPEMTEPVHDVIKKIELKEFFYGYKKLPSN